MKVLGKTSGGYIAEVSHSELEKVFDKFYGNMPPLAIGSEVHLGEGYSFRGEIRIACKGMVDAIKQFETAQNSLINFAIMVADLPEENEAAE